MVDVKRGLLILREEEVKAAGIILGEGKVFGHMNSINIPELKIKASLLKVNSPLSVAYETAMKFGKDNHSNLVVISNFKNLDEERNSVYSLKLDAYRIYD